MLVKIYKDKPYKAFTFELEGLNDDEIMDFYMRNRELGYTVENQSDGWYENEVIRNEWYKIYFDEPQL